MQNTRRENRLQLEKSYGLKTEGEGRKRAKQGISSALCMFMCKIEETDLVVSFKAQQYITTMML